MTVAAPPSPYKGLAPFGESALDALLFFGRGRETEVVAANLLAYRLTVLYGASGVGKSSLLRAGVAHALRQAGEEVIIFDAWSGDSTAGLRGSVSAARDQELYLILDQFDEYFVYHEADEEFPRELARLVTQPGLRFNVLISIRDDMLSRLDRFKPLVPNLLSNYLRLDHLDRHAARQAILGPLERCNALVAEDERTRIEPDLVEAVLDGSGTNGHIEAPYLQLVMQRLWEEEHRAGSKILRLETLEQLGGPEEIVRAHLSEALDTLSPHDCDLAERLFDHLVTPSGTKIAYGIVDLAQYAAVSEAEVAPVLAALVDERILRPVSVPGVPEESRYEIFHDVLAEPVLEWRSRYEEDRKLGRERADARRRHRRLLAVTVVALVIAGAMLALAAFAFSQRDAAQSAARHARGRELAAKALTGLSFDPQLSLRQAVDAARLDPGSASEDTLRRVLVGSYERSVLPQGAPALAATFTPSGRGLVVSTPDEIRLLSASGHVMRRQVLPAHGKPLVLDPQGRILAFASGGVVHVRSSDGRRIAELRAPGPVSAAALSPDGQRAAVIADDARGHSLTRIFALHGGRLLHVLPEIGMLTTAFSPDGRLVATGSAHGLARLWDARTGKLLHSLPHEGDVTALAFSRDGRLLATASGDGLGRVWDTATGGSVVVLAASTQPLRDISFSPDGRFVVTASADGKAYVYKVADSLLLATLAGSQGAVNTAEFGPGGWTVATASDDGTVRLWRPGVEDQLRLVRRSAHPVVASFGANGRIVTRPSGREATTAVSPDGRFGAKIEGTVVRVTDRKTGVSHGLTGPFTRIHAIAFSPDGHWLAAGAWRAATLWRLRPGARGELFSYLNGHEGRYRGKAAHLTSVAFSANGRRIVTASTDHTVRVYNCDVCGRLGSLVELAERRLNRLR